MSEDPNEIEHIQKEGLDDYHEDAVPTKPKPSVPTTMGVLKKKNVPFWSDNPNILFQQPYVLEFFPVNGMTFEQKLNALTRTVIVLTVLTFVYTRNTRVLAVSAVTVLAIYLLFYHKNLSKENFVEGGRHVRFNDYIEGFSTDVNGVSTKVPSLDKNGLAVPSDLYDLPVSSHNPMGNVLLTDYDYNPEKKPAPPSYTEATGKDILKQAKEMVVKSNPGQPDIANKLFSDLGDELNFEQSMRPFYSTASTTIPNDQNAFADFCYGSMISCKEGNMFACARNNGARYNNY
jgi:hypothetical protein